jgi:hypothetical protein
MTPKKQDSDHPVAPSNWVALIDDCCDIDRAYDALAGFHHFHTETYRGRLRSMQFRTSEAWDHFRRAAAMAVEFEDTERNLLRRFYLKLYQFDNILIEQSTPGTAQDVDVFESAFQDLCFGDAPETAAVHQVQLHIQGIYHLHREDFFTATRIYTQLFEECGPTMGDEKTGFHLTASAAFRGFGDRTEGDRHLDCGCLLIPMLKHNFNAGFYACTASAILKLWERDQEAREWDGFLERLKLPRKTRDLFHERANRIFERSRELQRAFLF